MSTDRVEEQGSIFHPEDTTPKYVGWLNMGGGFVIAALPTPRLHPVLILILEVEEDDAELVAASIALAQQLGCPRDLARVYLYRPEEGRNAPVTFVVRDREERKVIGFGHPSIAEEEFVAEQVRMSGALK